MNTISRIRVRQILDSRGEWTIAVSLTLLSGATGIASVPQGKSVSIKAKRMLRAEDALARIQSILIPTLVGQSFAHQRDFDARLIELDGTKTLSRIGANGALALSLAFARAVSKSMYIPLHTYIGHMYEVLTGAAVEPMFPRLYMNMINGGMHASSGLAIQEYLVIPKTKEPQVAIQLGVRFYHALKKMIEHEYGSTSANSGDEGGFALQAERIDEPFVLYQKVADMLGVAQSIEYGIDVAGASVADTIERSLMRFEALVDTYPIIYIEDPFKEKQARHFTTLLSRIGAHVTIVGDDISATNILYMEELAQVHAINGVIIKPNQIGTLSDTLQAVSFARKQKWSVVVSHRSGETNDTAIVDIACAIGADGLKLGAPARGERIAKYNRLLELSSQ